MKTNQKNGSLWWGVRCIDFYGLLTGNCKSFVQAEISLKRGLTISNHLTLPICAYQCIFVHIYAHFRSTVSRTQPAWQDLELHMLIYNCKDYDTDFACAHRRQPIARWKPPPKLLTVSNHARRTHFSRVNYLTATSFFRPSINKLIKKGCNKTFSTNIRYLQAVTPMPTWTVQTSVQ